MRISEIYNLKNDEMILNEQNFDSFGILDSKTDKTLCTFIDDEKYLGKLTSNMKMIITTQHIFEQLRKRECGFLITNNPRLLFFLLHNSLKDNEQYTRRKIKTKIGKNCNISSNVFIEPYNVVIGDNVTIGDFSSIKENTVIENNCVIGSCSVVGGDGFECKKVDDRIVRINHYGGVILKKNVTIDNNVCIDKALYPWDDTIVEEYTCVDNLVHIAHACKIGKRVLITAGSIIAGRVEISDDSWIGIGATIRNGIKIGKSARCNMGAVVTKDVMDEQSVSGNFAIDHIKFIDNIKKQSRED